LRVYATQAKNLRCEDLCFGNLRSTQDSCIAKSEASTSEHDDHVVDGLGDRIVSARDLGFICTGCIFVTVISSSPLENEHWLRLLLGRNDMMKTARPKPKELFRSEFEAQPGIATLNSSEDGCWGNFPHCHVAQDYMLFGKGGETGSHGHQAGLCRTWIANLNGVWGGGL
jgi:hypothetical protein